VGRNVIGFQPISNLADQLRGEFGVAASPHVGARMAFS